MTYKFDKMIKLLIESPKGIMPIPQRLYPKVGLAAVEDGGRKGGTYLNKERKDITGTIYASGYIDSDFDGMKAELNTSNEISELPIKNKGDKIIRTNLFRRIVGNFPLWKWIERPRIKNNPDKIVSIEQGSKHFYAMRVNFETPLHLAAYPEKKSEPRLRPTAHGSVSFGSVIGQIEISNKKVHDVYDVITII